MQGFSEVFRGLYKNFYQLSYFFNKAFKDPQTPQFIFMFGKIREYINELLTNENGNFVIQKCLEIYDHQYLKYLLDEIKKEVIFSCQIKIKKNICNKVESSLLS